MSEISMVTEEVVGVNFGLAIRTFDKEAVLDAEGVSDQQFQSVIDGFFANLNGVTPPQRPVSEEGINEAPAAKPEPPVEAVPKNTSYEPAEAKAEVKQEPQLPKEQTEDEYHYITEDRVGQLSNDAPDHLKTGIKIINHVEHFKTRYVCPKCEKKGSRYIPEGATSTDCHHCMTTMQVKKAVPGVYGLDRDAFGNFYVAGSQKPVKVVSVDQYKKLNKRS